MHNKDSLIVGKMENEEQCAFKKGGCPSFSIACWRPNLQNILMQLRVQSLSKHRAQYTGNFKESNLLTQNNSLELDRDSHRLHFRPQHHFCRPQLCTYVYS